ncbi:MAG: DUF2332 family protein [Salaquimonas sp.]
MTNRESDIRASFITQAVACETLGSPFTGRLCRLIAKQLDVKSELGKHVFSWSGDYSARADNVALRLCGAINHLVLTQADAELAKIYPPVTAFSQMDDAEVWKHIIAAIERHTGPIKAFMQSAPQTNEVRRSAALIPAYHAIANRFDLPINLHELGASAGLNLYPDLYGIETPEVQINPETRLVLTPRWRGEVPLAGNLEINNRRACDLVPIDISDEANCLRMLAYIWPDQIDRVSRTKAAIELAQENQLHLVEQADAIGWLEERLQNRTKNTAGVFHHTIAWQYFPNDQQAKGEALFEEHGKDATEASPLIRISMESDGKGASEGASLTMTIWPSGKTHNLGRADFHGRWIDWKNPEW